MEANNLNLEHKISNEDWENMEFTGKEYCYLKENHLLQLKATSFSPEKTLCSLDNHDSIDEIKLLADKFEELQSQVNELDSEWEKAEDILKLENKIHKIRNHSKHINAIGDFEQLFSNLENKQKALEEVYQSNYQKRLAILTQAESLVEEKDKKEGEEEIDFKVLKEEWKNGPEIKKDTYAELNKRFELAENKFYDLKRKAFQEKEIELMQNLDLKMEICEKAEKLKDSDEWRKATEGLEELFEEWKKIGQVTSAEKNDELWQRFNDARHYFFQRKREHSENIKQEQEKNYEQKLVLVEKAEVLKESTEWKKTTESFSKIMEEWRKIGRVPLEKSDEIWQKLQAAKNTFFEAKQESTKSFLATLEENYAKRQILAKEAEEAKHSKNWEETTIVMNELLDEWKKTGPIPKAYGDDLWESFIAARKFFFNNKDAERDARRARYHHQINNRLHQTAQFLDKLEKELEVDEADLKEFKVSLENTSEDQHKGEELKLHLSNLIQNLEKSIPSKKQKIEEVILQKEELTEKCKEVNNRMRKNNSNA